MDQADRSFQEEQSNIDDQVRQARLASGAIQTPTGYCLTCYEDLPPKKLFCNAACADEHEHLRKHRFACH